MAKPTAPQCHALTTYYVSAYTKAFNSRPVVNRNKARWGFESILMDYPPEDAKRLIDYYLEHFENLSLDWFLFNYDKVEQHRMDAAREAKLAAARRKETEARMKEWRERWQK